MLKYLTLFICTLFLAVSICSAHDDSSINTADAAPQAKEILGTLSNLVNNKDERDNSQKAKEVSINVKDLEEAIKVMENSADRKKVVTALKGILKLQQEESKKESLIQNASLNITNFIERTAEALLNSFALLGKMPEHFINEINKFGDAAYRANVFSLLFILLISLGLALGMEYVVRALLLRLNIRRPDEFVIKKLPVHITRNVTPVILFGLVAYVIIFLTQRGWTPITSKGFMVVTIIVMLRTAWLVLRVLFVSRLNQPVPRNAGLEASSYHFLLAVSQVIIIGIVFAEVSILFGMGSMAYYLWLRIIGFGVTSLIVIGIFKIRYAIFQYFKYNGDSLEGITLHLAKFIEFLGRYWHWIISLWLISCYVLWLTQFTALAWVILTALVSIIVLTIFFLLGRRGIDHLIKTFQAKLKMNESNIALASLGYLEGSLGRGIIFVWHVLYFVLILEFCGAEPINLVTHSTSHPYLTRAISILITFLIIRALWLWIDHVAQSQMMSKKVGKRQVEPSQFIKTLTPILRSLAHWFLFAMTVILVLVELKIPVEPILYFFGLFGLAVSFASQGLFKDLINGILNLMEGNIVVGEVITVGNNTGTVETLSLRGLSLRHSNGSLQSITFSEITNIINKSRNYTVVPVEITVPYHTDIGAVHKVLLSAYMDICKDPIFGKQIIDPLAISGVDRFSDNGFTVTGNIKVKPDPKNRFLKAFNQCLKNRLELDSILPPPSQKIININVDEAQLPPRPKSKKKTPKDS